MTMTDPENLFIAAIGVLLIVLGLFAKKPTGKAARVGTLSDHLLFALPDRLYRLAVTAAGAFLVVAGVNLAVDW